MAALDTPCSLTSLIFKSAGASRSQSGRQYWEAANLSPYARSNPTGYCCFHNPPIDRNQRTHPLKFAVEPGFVLGKNDKIPGKWFLDKAFDGNAQTKPNGVIYVVIGAGGARLYDEEQTTDPSTWQEFTKVFISNTHSFTVLDVTSKQLRLRQVSSSGVELDKLVIEK